MASKKPQRRRSSGRYNIVNPLDGITNAAIASLDPSSNVAPVATVSNNVTVQAVTAADRQISQKDFDSLLKKMNVLSDNNDKFVTLVESVNKKLLSSKQMLLLIETTPSVKTRMLMMLEVLAPRCSDPGDASAIIESFRFTAERQQVSEVLHRRERVLKANSLSRSRSTSTSGYVAPPSLLSDPNSRGRSGRGRGGAGRGGRSGGRGGRGGVWGGKTEAIAPPQTLSSLRESLSSVRESISLRESVSGTTAHESASRRPSTALQSLRASFSFSSKKKKSNKEPTPQGALPPPPEPQVALPSPTEPQVSLPPAEPTSQVALPPPPEPQVALPSPPEPQVALPPPEPTPQVALPSPPEPTPQVALPPPPEPTPQVALPSPPEPQVALPPPEPTPKVALPPSPSSSSPSSLPPRPTAQPPSPSSSSPSSLPPRPTAQPPSPSTSSPSSLPPRPTAQPPSPSSSSPSSLPPRPTAQPPSPSSSSPSPLPPRPTAQPPSTSSSSLSPSSLPLDPSAGAPANRESADTGRESEAWDRELSLRKSSARRSMSHLTRMVMPSKATAEGAWKKQHDTESPSASASAKFLGVSSLLTSKAPQVISTGPDIHHEGWVFNRSGVIAKSWDNRYFVMKREKEAGEYFIFVSKDKWSGDPSEEAPIAKISLRNSPAKELPMMDSWYPWSIKHHLFRVNNSNDRSAWCMKINEAIQSMEISE